VTTATYFLTLSACWSDCCFVTWRNNWHRKKIK